MAQLQVELARQSRASRRDKLTTLACGCSSPADVPSRETALVFDCGEEAGSSRSVTLHPVLREPLYLITRRDDRTAPPSRASDSFARLPESR